jgi:hypothetical protein
MRCTEPLSRVVAGFFLIALGLVPAMAETSRGEPDLRVRVFFDRSADPLPSRADTRIVPLPVSRLPSAAITEMMPAATGRGTVTVLAVLAPPKDGPMLDTGLPPWAGPRPLPWASGPAVPRPLSEPPPQLETTEKRRVPEAQVPTLPKPPAPPVMVHPHAGTRHVASQNLWAERDGATMSRVPGTPKVSSHAGDPIAALEFEEKKHTARQVDAPAFIMPFAKGRVTSLFNQGRRHPAIDLAGALGSSVLATTMRQTVVFAGWRGGYGNAVIARDPSGRLHLYGHLRSIASRVGQILDQGVKLGHLGSTGRSTGPHVHYEVRDSKGRHINPVTLLFPGRAVSKGFAWADVRLAPRPTRVASNQPRPR